MKALFALLLVTILTRCECDLPDIYHGELEIHQSSRDAIPYADGDTLVFMDEDSVEYDLFSDEGWNEAEVRLTSKLLCDMGPFDKQREYFDSEYHTISFRSAEVPFSLRASISIRDDQGFTKSSSEVDSFILFDHLNVQASWESFYHGGIDIMTFERNGTASEEYKKEIFRESRVIEDTVLMGKRYQGLYVEEGSESRRIYFQKGQGVVALGLADSSLVVFDRVK